MRVYSCGREGTQEIFFEQRGNNEGTEEAKAWGPATIQQQLAPASLRRKTAVDAACNTPERNTCSSRAPQRRFRCGEKTKSDAHGQGTLHTPQDIFVNWSILHSRKLGLGPCSEMPVSCARSKPMSMSFLLQCSSCKRERWQHR